MGGLMKFKMTKCCTAVFLVLGLLCTLSGCREEGNTANETIETSRNGAALSEATLPTVTVTVADDTESATLPAETIPVERSAWYETSRLIYHAAGKIDGFTYTNSKEALENALQQGYMLIELDFLFTSDGHLVCLHEWSNLLGLGGPVPLERFLSLKMYNRFTTITAADVMGYMDQYEDMYLIIDTKEEDAVGVVAELLRLCGSDPDIASRLVIQLYDSGVRQQMQELYAFADDNFLFTSYKFGPQRISEIMELCQEEGIRVIAAPYGSWDKATVQKMKDAGFLVFEHTVNFTNMTDNAVNRGVYGFFTDSLLESDVEFSQ